MKVECGVKVECDVKVECGICVVVIVHAFPECGVVM